MLAASGGVVAGCGDTPTLDPPRWTKVAEGLPATAAVVAQAGSKVITLSRADGTHASSLKQPIPWRDLARLPAETTVKKFVTSFKNETFALTDRGIYKELPAGWAAIGPPAADLVGGNTTAMEYRNNTEYTVLYAVDAGTGKAPAL